MKRTLRTIWCLFFFLLIIPAFLAHAEQAAKPDFSGEWKDQSSPTCWIYKFLIDGRDLTIIARCGNDPPELWASGTVDGRNFEASHPGGRSAVSPGVKYPKRVKGFLSEDNKSIQISWIIAPELARTEEAKEAARAAIQVGRTGWTTDTLIRISR